MAGNLLNINPKNLVTGTAVAATATSTATSIGLADSYTICINVTAVTGTSPTLDVVIQGSLDGGTTFMNLPLRSAQITAATVQYISFRNGLAQGEAGFNQAGVADTGGALTKDVVFDPRFIKVKQTVAGTNPSFTYTITCFGMPRSSQAV
jgi:hypothetical protein